MQLEQVARNDILKQAIEEARAARRREYALLRAPVTSPSRYPKKEIRRLCGEVKEELARRG